jgi:hypothetical protein
MGLEVVGGILTKRGIHGGNGNAHGRRRGSAAGHCGMGSGEVVGACCVVNDQPIGNPKRKV